MKKVLLVANLTKEHILKFHVPSIKMLKEDGWQVDIASSGDEKVAYCDNQYKMQYKRSPFSIKTLSGIFELKKIIDKNDYDIIYCNTIVGGIVSRFASIQTRKKGTRVIYNTHGFHFFKGSSLISWGVYFIAEYIMSFLTDAIIAVNQEDYNLMKNKFHIENNYIIDGMGVDLHRYNLESKNEVRNEYRKQLNIASDVQLLIYVAELTENKNQKILIDAVKLLCDRGYKIKLLLVGPDHNEGKMQLYAKSQDMQNQVLFLGWRSDVPQLYTASDICVASSLREGFGINLVEAMASELPVVASKNRGHCAVIKDGKDGYLFDLKNVNSLADKISLLIDNPDIKDKIIKEANNSVVKFSQDNVLTQIKDIFDIEYNLSNYNKSGISPKRSSNKNV